jgi:hypothetical protein
MGNPSKNTPHTIRKLIARTPIRRRIDKMDGILHDIVQATMLFFMRIILSLDPEILVAVLESFAASFVVDTTYGSGGMTVVVMVHRIDLPMVGR